MPPLNKTNPVLQEINRLTFMKWAQRAYNKFLGAVVNAPTAGVIKAPIYPQAGKWPKPRKNRKSNLRKRRRAKQHRHKRR